MTGRLPPNMLKRLRVACVQMGASESCQQNLSKAASLVLKAIHRKAKFITLPENFLWRGPSKDLKRTAAETPAVIKHFQKIAKEHRVSILLGSLLEPGSRRKYYNVSVLIAESGRVIARYRKIHLFGIKLSKVRTDESRHIQSGKKPVTGKVFGIPAGLTICYDVRFPELFRKLIFKGARLITVPANFTDHTGRAHWEVLIRSRAIENQAFVIAPAQVGISPSNKIKSFGTSLIVDPWGIVLARGSRDKDQVITADLDFKAQNELRARFPVLRHAKI